MAAYATPSVFPRWPLPVQNNTVASLPRTSQEQAAAQAQETPSAIPSPTYKPVSVVPAGQIAQSTTTHVSIPSYPGPSASLLQGYCTDPGFTILDAGPTALWIPVVGCISSKSDCCVTSTTNGGSGPVTTGSGAVTTGGSGSGSGDGGDSNGGGGGSDGSPNGAQFPISYMPSQGTLTGCPQDYHTVTLSGGKACCPSSYWLWDGNIGGQVPCYSSLSKTLDVPPMPDTLAHITGASTTTDSATASAKPTSAINNIAFAMQYPVVDGPKPALKKEAKIGIGVGVSGAAIVFGLLVWFLVRKFAAHKKRRENLQDATVHQRFGTGVDMSRVAHEQPPMSRSYGGTTYTGVPTRHAGY